MGLHSSHPITEITADFTMSSTSTAVNTFNKSKEDFIWFVKKAVQDKKSYSYSELYHSLLKIFVDADTNRDGLVSKASFSKLIDAAASMPRAYGYAPADSDLYKTDADKDAARQKMFDSVDLKATGVITFDEWLKFCREHIAAKTATMDPHPIIAKEAQMSTRSLSKLLSTSLTAPRPWNCTGTCWRSLLNMIHRKRVSSSWTIFHP